VAKVDQKNRLRSIETGGRTTGSGAARLGDCGDARPIRSSLMGSSSTAATPGHVRDVAMPGNFAHDQWPEQAT
jgi:hypothetical protein